MFCELTQAQHRKRQRAENGNFSSLSHFLIALTTLSLFSDMRQSLINIWQSDRSQKRVGDKANKKKLCVPESPAQKISKRENIEHKCLLSTLLFILAAIR